MDATHLPVDRLATASSETVHVIATSLDGTREALEAATALARGCHVTFVHVPHRRFVQPFIAATGESAQQAAQDQSDNAR